MFACAHPAIDVGIRAPLILQTILGFDAVDYRLRLPGLARYDEPAAGASQEQDPAGGHPVPGARTRGSARASGCGTRGDLRRVRRRLVGSRRHRGPAPQPRRRGDLAWAGWWPRFSPRSPKPSACFRSCCTPRHGAARAVDVSGEYVPLAEQDPALWDARLDRRSRSAAVARQSRRCDRPLPAGSRRAVGPRGSAAYRPFRLGGDRASVRRAVGAHRLTSRGDQPRHRSRRDQRGPPPVWFYSTRWLTMRGLPTISRTGPRGPDCWRAAARPGR